MSKNNIELLNALSLACGDSCTIDTIKRVLDLVVSAPLIELLSVLSVIVALVSSKLEGNLMLKHNSESIAHLNFDLVNSVLKILPISLSRFEDADCSTITKIESYGTSYGRIIMCCTLLLDYIKGKLSNESIQCNNMSNVIYKEHVLFTLECINSCLLIWRNNTFRVPKTTELELPKCLTGPFLAQLVELLLFYCTSAKCFGGVDGKEVSQACLSNLNLLFCIVKGNITIDKNETSPQLGLLYTVV